MNENILFLDISSTCTGYVLTNNGKLLDIGVKWFHKDNKTPQKCQVMYDWVYDKHMNEGLDRLVYERYSFNMKNPNGALACPHIQGAILAASQGLIIEDITPQTWRKQCGLKKPKGGDWKKIVEVHFRALYDIPEKIESNITGNLRTTPSDYFDALGICIGWCNMNGLKLEWK